MSKRRSVVADYCVYLAVRLFVCVAQALPLSTGLALAGGLARLAYRLDRRHREVARANLQDAFPGRYGEVELDAVVHQVYRHFCGLLIEIAHLPRKLHPNNWRRHLNLVGGDRVMACLLSGRPLMLVTGHFGNWELAGYILGLLGLPGYAIARPLDNPFLDDYLRRFRERTGQKLLAKQGDFDRIEQILAGGGVLGTLADQDAGARGLFVDFFGRPASTHKAVALLSLEHQVPLMVVGARKLGDPLRYEVLAEDLILPEDYASRPDAVRAITQRFTAGLERLVRSAPAQYFWLHRRWKHQPKRRRQVA